jgi:hypothetical protein
MNKRMSGAGSQPAQGSQSRLFLVLALAAVPILQSAENTQPAAVDVVVERKDGSEWRAVDPHYVFASQDQIRFVFRSDVPGNLYVMNRAPSGASDWIFPAPGTDPENRVAAGQSYRIPAQGGFVIGGPPGFDTTVWILSPHALQLGSAADAIAEAPKERGTNSQDNLIPRCSDTLLVARGPCTDDRAGAAPFHERLNLPQSDGLVARDLNFSNDGGRTRITPRDQTSGNVIVYEFRIAHR